VKVGIVTQNLNISRDSANASWASFIEIGGKLSGTFSESSIQCIKRLTYSATFVLKRVYHNFIYFSRFVSGRVARFILVHDTKT
jgi:hypothetical protein